MDWLDVYWDDDIEQYIAQHGVSRDDFEHALRHPLGEVETDRSGRPLRFGFAADGRRIAVVYEMVDAITVLPVTAYEVK